MIPILTVVWFVVSASSGAGSGSNICMILAFAKGSAVLIGSTIIPNISKSFSLFLVLTLLFVKFCDRRLAIFSFMWRFRNWYGKLLGLWLDWKSWFYRFIWALAILINLFLVVVDHTGWIQLVIIFAIWLRLLFIGNVCWRAPSKLAEKTMHVSVYWLAFNQSNWLLANKSTLKYFFSLSTLIYVIEYINL